MADLANEFDRPRLLQLVDARCNGALDDAGRAELEAMLIASPAACAEYWAAIKIHAGLERELSSSENWEAATKRLLGDGPILEKSPGSVRTSGIPNRRPISSLRIGLLLASAACLLIGVFIGVWSPWRQVAGKDPRALQRPGSQAEDSVLGRLTPLAPNSRWSFVRRSDHESRDVRVGDTLSIDVGAVALRLSNDVVAKMRAPLVLQLSSVEHVRLIHGRLQVDVPEGAKGFSVETATAEIVDLGTTFAVEAVGGGTDLIVLQGEVDLKVTGKFPEDQQPGRSVKRFREGEAVRVDVDGTLSRIVNVRAADMLAFDTAQSGRSLVVSVRDNLVRDDLWKFYEIVPAGLTEDAKAYVDRPHEWNGATGDGLPDYLERADYVKTFNDDKITPDLVIELELAGPSTVYVFLDQRLTPPAWLVERFIKTGDAIGIDESHEIAGPTLTGPGVSIDQTLSVWRFVAEHGGVVQLGPNGVPAPHDSVEVLYVPSNMYGIAVTSLARDAR
jgi:hypothetical protein